LLVAFMLFSISACAAPAGTPESGTAPATPFAAEQTPVLEAPRVEPLTGGTPADEYARAVWYGFLPDDLAAADPNGTTVTWAQYCDMLGRMIKLHDESAIPAWEEMTKDAPDTEMKRDGAAITLLFAAQLSGKYYCNASPDDRANESYSWGDHFSWDYPIFDWDSEVAPLDDDMEVWDRSNAIASAYWYLLGRISCITTQPLLDVDAGDPHFEEALTLAAAMLSVVRLYESDEEVALKTADALLEMVKETPEGQAVIAAAEQRKAEILSTETLIEKAAEYIQGETYTGTAYYVSNAGNDSADGLSPETAWASLERVGKAHFSYGDAIFFERGGLWRKATMPESVVGTEGLTLSAYGTGEKPRFYGSPESGAGEEKWTLYHEGADGRKIWVYHMDMPDCAGVILNGKEIIKRDIAYWNGASFMCMNDLDQPYTVETQLEDLESFCALPYQQPPKGEYLNEAQSLGLAYYVDENGENLMGPLYVRCDAGNPGELYDEIEFISAYHIGSMPDHTTLDNLCFRYSTTAVCGGYWEGVSHDYLTFQNCEVGFNGGALNWFAEKQNAAGFGHAHMDGGGLNVNGSYTTIQNCYTHHIFQEGIAMETFDGDPEPAVGDSIRDNVIEYCVMGLLVVNWETDEVCDHVIRDMLVENNYVLYSGFETLYNAKPPIEPGDMHWPLRLGFVTLDTAALTVKRGGEDYRVTGNTFAFSASQLIQDADIDIPQPAVYSGNTYAPLPGFAASGTLVNAWGPLVKELDVNAIVRDTLQDNTAIIVRFDE
ncbi:MAG: hypothetical protein PHO41_02690, partial [Eubacteriales bacterium]|nr:hypothetical protein [Eubacteriales bacterium]